MIFALRYPSLCVSDVDLALHYLTMISSWYRTQPPSISLPIRSSDDGNINSISIPISISSIGLGNSNWETRTRKLEIVSRSKTPLPLPPRQQSQSSDIERHQTIPNTITTHHLTTPYNGIGINPSPRIHDPDGLGPLWELLKERGL
jgi:hypothetical protein